MTDKLPSLLTPIAPPSRTPFSVSSAVPVQDGTRAQENAEEEPYTIRCICKYPDDDGNTIYCDRCDTWQHIECYYPNNSEDALRNPDFAHFCVDCKPRPLDRERAKENQRRKLTTGVTEGMTDKKSKRPLSKSHKKKPKPSDLPLTGQHSKAEKHASTQDNHPPPPKKSKSSHKSSQSISSQAAKGSPQFGSTKSNHAHPPSPAATPPDLPADFEIHTYAPALLSGSSDRGVEIVHTNSFASLQVSNAISDWLRDHNKLQKETGWAYADIFQPLPPNIDQLKRPVDIELSRKTLGQGTVASWKCLKAPSGIAHNVPLVELNGQIGIQSSYCADPDSRWQELTSPLPYVFFHPMLPIYIDTRKEGSQARYIRRSCRPNAMLETYLSDGYELHFWLVTDRQVSAKEEITLPWDFRFPNENKSRMLRVLGLSDEDTSAHAESSVDDGEYQALTSWLHNILSEYGGCACNLGSECAFARFHRNHLGKSQAPANPPKTKKRKSKTQSLSATGTGPATDSRAASEGHLEDAPENDRRSSVSGSARSKPPSRDLTPTARQGSFDTLGILTEPTDRDKRKVSMIEETFRRIELQQPTKKRKARGSIAATDSATTSKKGSKSSAATQTTNATNGADERHCHFADGETATTSKATSPAASAKSGRVTKSKKTSSRKGSVAVVSHPVPAQPVRLPSRPKYADAATQTNPDTEANPAPSPARPKRKLVSVTMRIVQHHRWLQEQRRQQRLLNQAAAPVPMEVDSPKENKTAAPVLGSVQDKASEPSAPAKAATSDVEMPDAPTVSASHPKAAQSSSVVTAPKSKPVDLKVPMPPVPPFPSSTSLASTSATPLSAGTSVAQSPFSVTGLPSPFGPPSVNGLTANPSPIKKKLSLSDYTKSRMNKAAAARPSVSAPSLKPIPALDEPKSTTNDDNGGAASGSPTTEKTRVFPCMD
ncbi:hypothetical protein B0H65DRAFT_434250 [Neurospora tetraspora]|uniref:SET domain-containing protein n=1 Tax=Neurospora tetraspora TaxID=94610 RepID=A0AAE0J7E3_9PEZI|nr:hypothetical protein B0H65DRAFT_434250 [Neurospora tetraspora]